MHRFQNYNFNIIKYDLINKFIYNKVTQIPKLQFIVLRFDIKTLNIKFLMSALLALELLTLQKGKFLRSKKSNITVKIRKGHPVGSIVVLRNRKKIRFLVILINKIICSQLKLTAALKTQTFSFKISDILVFNELKDNYQFFKNLRNLHINLVTNSQNKSELKFLIKSYKLI